MRWVRPQSFLSRESGHEPQRRAHECPAVSARISRFRLAAARHVSALSVWHRRFGIVSLLVDRSSPSMPAKAWWQSLPLGPTGYGNSPYQPMSSFAGNALLISPGSLISDGLLQASDSCSLTSRPMQSTTTLSSRSNSGYSKRRGHTSKLESP